MVPVALTLNDADCPAVTVWFVGCAMICGLIEYWNKCYLSIRRGEVPQYRRRAKQLESERAYAHLDEIFWPGTQGPRYARSPFLQSPISCRTVASTNSSIRVNRGKHPMTGG